ncbi:MAG: hypothetical protein GY869_12620 [Planctomycetes bacterium]|nr:hypothetical protein [Planctomycetota bacterium]
MKRCRSKGYVMMLAILILSLAGMAVIIVNMGTISILYESRRAYFEACSRNLAASGRAWACEAAGIEGKDLPAGVTEINVDSMKIPQGSLSVEVIAPNEPGLAIEISTVCGRGDTTLRRRHTYQVKD